MDDRRICRRVGTEGLAAIPERVPMECRQVARSQSRLRRWNIWRHRPRFWSPIQPVSRKRAPNRWGCRDSIRERWAGSITVRSRPSWVTSHQSTDRALIDRRLYLPEESWLADPDRCAEAGVPTGTTFKTRPQQVIEMIEAARHGRRTVRLVHRRRGIRAEPRAAGVPGKGRHQLRDGHPQEHHIHRYRQAKIPKSTSTR